MSIVSSTSSTTPTSSTSSTAAASVPAAPITVPVGTSPALYLMNDEPAFRGHSWPPQDLINDNGYTFAQLWQNDPIYGTTAAFPDLDRGWEQPFSNYVVLTRYLADPDWQVTKLHAILQAVWTAGVARASDPKPTPNTLSELDELIVLAEYRPGVLDEAQVQANSIVPYFAGLLNFKASSYPYTYLVASAAELVGLVVAMHWKSQFNRPRPSRVCPKLLPPVDVPGHASLPSGHATQSHLIALCLADVMPSQAWQSTGAKSGNPVTWLDPMLDKLRGPGGTFNDANGTPLTDAYGHPLLQPLQQGPLFRMAERIARNREVLGLHYPSDSLAGKVLAMAVHAKLWTTLNTINPRNQDTIVNLARAEWGLERPAAPPGA